MAAVTAVAAVADMADMAVVAVVAVVAATALLVIASRMLAPCSLGKVAVDETEMYFE